MGAPSLRSLAQRECIRNIDSVKSVGDMEYRLVFPILDAITNPDQLQEIEENSPHIAEHDAILWKKFIMRDIIEWKKKKFEPKNPTSWGKVYRKMLRDQQREHDEQDEQLRANMAEAFQKKEESRVKFVQRVMPEPQRQTAFLDGKPNPNAGRWGISVQPVKKPALKNAKTGADVMSALRKQSSTAAKWKSPTTNPPFKRTPVPAPKTLVTSTQKPGNLNPSRTTPMAPQTRTLATTTATNTPPTETDRYSKPSRLQEYQQSQTRMRVPKARPLMYRFTGGASVAPERALKAAFSRLDRDEQMAKESGGRVKPLVTTFSTPSETTFYSKGPRTGSSTPPAQTPEAPFTFKAGGTGVSTPPARTPDATFKSKTAATSTATGPAQSPAPARTPVATAKPNTETTSTITPPARTPSPVKTPGDSPKPVMLTPAPVVSKKRSPAPVSIFMPTKKRKVK